MEIDVKKCECGEHLKECNKDTWMPKPMRDYMWWQRPRKAKVYSCEKCNVWFLHLLNNDGGVWKRERLQYNAKRRGSGVCYSGVGLVKFHQNGSVQHIKYFNDEGQNGIETKFYANGEPAYKCWWVDGSCHNILGPAEITYKMRGGYGVAKEKYYIDGKYWSLIDWKNNPEVIKAVRRKKLEQIGI